MPMRDLAILAVLLPIGLLCLGTMRAIVRGLQARRALTAVKFALIIAAGYFAMTLSIVFAAFVGNPSRLPPSMLWLAIAVTFASALFSFPLAVGIYKWLPKLRTGNAAKPLRPPDGPAEPPTG